MLERRGHRPPRTRSFAWRLVAIPGLAIIGASGACGGGDDDTIFGAGSGASAGSAGNGGGTGAGAARICEPGLTRECVGDGACRGGQLCRPDGAAWSECRCGGAGASTAGAGGSGGAAGTGGSSAAGGAGNAGANGGAAGAGGTDHAGAGSAAGQGGTQAEGGAAGEGGANAGGDAGASAAGTGGVAGADAGGASGQAGAPTAGAAGASGEGGQSGSSNGGNGGGGNAGSGGAIACEKKADCGADQLCSILVTKPGPDTLECGPISASPSSRRPGEFCSTAAECGSLSCARENSSAKGVCLATCETKAACSPNAVCFDQPIGQDGKARVCAPGCERQSGCDPNSGRTCAFFSDPFSDTVGFACTRSLGPTPFGGTPSASQPCQSGIVIGGKCSRPCTSAADCAAPFPSCKSGPIGTPSGSTAIIRVCTPS